ncbi:Ger(x)C family spore germination protein [Bacillus sp. EB600]|uniref:Ger(x)C family spore germination protein n=1 Tax=Bacillus sp. EB600 TaxID=2806345 RepID=UPI0021098D05|nr:Ger(x)C family spore germination protein [Bacillus sp. EB600]MCQ6282570.1 Ger(x)C family spore germination protein [Bacillus sp. EB600]
MNGFTVYKKKSVHVTLLICSSLFFLTGCWDRTEVNDLALIMASGIDKGKKNKIELSVQVFIPSPSQGGQQNGMSSGTSSGQTLVRSAEGETIADAMARLQEELTRKIFWGQSEVLLIGEKLAKKGLNDTVDFWVQHPEPRIRADVFVAKGKAKQILESKPVLERDIAQQLREMVKSQIGVKVTMKDLAEMLSSESNAAVLPWVEELPLKYLGSKKNKIPYVNRVAVFKGDKMVGRLNDKATRGILWPRNEMKTGVITISLKNKPGYITLNLIRSRNELVPSITNGKWRMLIKTDADLEVIQNTTKVNLFNPEMIKEAEQRAKQEIEGRERLAFSKAQKKLNADIFRFAESFQREYPKVWKTKKNKWTEIFPEVDVSFKTNLTIERTGLATGKKNRGETK